MEVKKYSIILVSIFLAILITVSSCFISGYGYSDGIVLNYFKEYKIILFNFVIIYLFLLTLTYILKSVKIAFLVTSLLVNIMAFVNYIKIIYREEPFNAIDFTLVREAFKMSTKYDLNLGKPNAIALIISVILTIIIFIGLLKYNFSYSFRFIKFVLVVFALVAFVKFYAFDYDLYHKLGGKTGLGMWVEVESYQSKGFAYPFVYSIKTTKAYKYNNYNKKRAEESYESYSYKDIPEDKKVNVVGVMLESFKDFYKYRNDALVFNRDPYEYFHKLQGESIYGSLLVNSFGGGTFFTESNALTGYKHNPPFNRTTDSYVRYFKDQGYSTFAYHPNTGSFYNRNRVYEKIGFDKFFEYDNTFKKLNENLLMDKDLYPFMLEHINEEIQKGNHFSFAVTYQNHGPYNTESINGDPPIQWQEGYDEKMYNYFNNYLLGIESASNSLQILVDNFRQSDKPIVFVFFGDHSPSMGDNKMLFDMFNINAQMDSAEGIKNIYETPYIVWANDAAKDIIGKDFKMQGRDMEPAFLFSEIFKYLGYKGSNYNQCITDLTDDLTVLKETIYCIDGKYVDTLPENIKEKVDNYENVEYYQSHRLDRE